MAPVMSVGRRLLKDRARTHTHVGVMFLLASLASSPAIAGGYSGDIELVRPVAGPGSLVAIPGDADRRPGTLSYGLVHTYSTNPLVLVEDGVELGSVVGGRHTLWGLMSVIPARGVQLDLSLPLMLQTGSTDPEYSADGGGWGDPFLGLGYTRQVGPWRFGGRAEVGFPIGRQGVWMGESAMRFSLAGVAHRQVGRLGLSLRVGTMTRNKANGPEDFRLGRELRLDPGARFDIVADKVAGWITVPMATHPSIDGALFAVEPVIGADVRAGSWMIGMGVGRGVTGGIGASDGRVLLSLSRVREPTIPPPPPTRIVHDPPDLVDAPDPPSPQVVEVPTPAAPTASLLQVGERLQFAQDSHELTPEGWAAVAEVARILRDHTDIFLVIEGHTSVEGSHDYNWDLSQRRGRSVYEALVTIGVDATRIAYRGRGELVPESAGTEDTPVSGNRRVIFDVLVNPTQARPVEGELNQLTQPKTEFDQKWDELP